MASSADEHYEKESEDKELTSASEDDDSSEDEEIRQMKEELERIRAEKKQSKKEMKKEKLRKLIEAEKSDLKSSIKGKSTKMSLQPEHFNDQHKLPEDNGAALTDRNLNLNDPIHSEVCRRGSPDSSNISTNAEHAEPTTQTLEMPENRRQAQEIVESRQNIPVDYIDFELFISKIGLGRFYPETLQLSDVMKIKAERFPRNLEDIATMFIRNLVMINFNCRDKVLEEYIHGIPLPDDEKLVSGDYLDRILGDQNKQNSNVVNPLDLILAVFKCSSPMLKQILSAKLFMCQLAIPLVFPAVGNDPLLVSMWPLRSLVIDRKTEKGSFQNTADNCPCQIISFIRFGRPTISKSKLINEILTDQYHNTFFNKDCPLGTTKRTLSEGMIESAWYLPSSKSTLFKNVCMFLNLRGDGENLAEQVKVVSKISSVVVITTEANTLDNTKCQQLILALQQEKTGVIIAIDAKKESKTSVKPKLQPYSDINLQLEKQTRCIILSIEDQDRSIAEIKNEMRDGIKELIHGMKDLPLSERLRKCSAGIDENNECYSKTRKMANGIIRLIPDKCTSTSAKEQVVPLQGELWRTWSKKNKDANKASKLKSLEEHEQFNHEMKQIRLKQMHMCEHLHSFMRTFLNLLLELLPSKKECEVFVLWLKHLFDERSRSILPTYLSKYQSDWQALKSARGQKNLTATKELRDQLDKSEYHLAEASFGFEHLCREMGQIYEAVCTCKTTDKHLEELKLQLPMVTAKLLLLGLPFEIMDGDAANVPILWVKAVLINLREMIGDKKLLALSVLGIQSSGKSTLLNTMFGLQFAVSAGRCTRGVFMQLVYVDDTCFPFDYILVIDTEGLRAPELGHQKYSHDNELATFVIGLGDITIVNIKGENTAEVKDVLQISVHAFLRLKLANKRLNLKQSCVFVHQNVPAIDANDKMMHGRQKFVEILDAMTKEAADQEDIAEIHSFNQVIEFDSEINVWYFSDLWRGDPPMCPANPGYSENVTNVRNAVFDLTKKRDTYLTLTDTISRIEDLWNGILKDDFVFSFRNSLELKAYNNMERKCQSLSWELEKSVLEFMRSDAESSLIDCKNPDDLDKVIPSITKRLATKIGTMVSSMLIELDAFIEGNTLKDVMIQWKQSKQNRFKILADDLIVKSRSEINKTKEEIRFKKIRVSEQTKHEMEINEMAKQLALKMRGKSPEETDLKQMFDEKWYTWIEKFASTDVLDVVSIKDQIESILCEKFPSDAAYLDETNTFDAQYYENMSKLECTIPIECISDKHISIHKKYYVLNKESLDKCKSQTFDITNKILRKIDTTLSELNAQDKRFHLSYVTEIVHIVHNYIDEHNSKKAKEYKFNLLPPFRAMILAHVLRYATFFFTTLNDAYNQKHSPKAQMQEYKGTAWGLFKNLVQSKTEDFIALGFFREAIMKTVVEHVSGLLPIDAQDNILSLFSNGKFSLLKDILIHLAETEDFVKIKQFIEDPRAFAEDWIIELTNKMLFEEETDGVNSFTRLAKCRISKIFSQLLKSILQATQSTKTSIAIWIERFVKHSNDSKGLPLSKATFVHVQDRNVPDLQNFVGMLKDEISAMEYDVIASFKEKAANTFKWKTNPVISIMDKLWGCTAVCMFCGEPCMNTDKNHTNDGHSHKCLQHRPVGIHGLRWEDNNKLCENFCNHLLNTDILYANIMGKTGKYREYKTNFPDWEIAPNSDASKYWKWIFVKFQKQLQKMHNTELPTFPAIWNTILKSEAIASLG